MKKKNRIGLTQSSNKLYSGMEIYWRDNFICPSEEEYKIMITRKTGGLFNLAVRYLD